MKMKLLPMLSVAAAMFLSSNLSAQRTIDWSVSSIPIPPSELREKADMSGSTYTLSAVFTNLGPDTARIGDTLLYRVVIPISQSQAILIPGPDINTYAIRVLTEDIAPNDTAMINLSGSVGFIPKSVSFYTNLTVASLLINGSGSDPIKLEDNSTNGNNALSEQVPWIVKQGWGVNVKTVDIENSFNIYPNPSTTGIFQINTLIRNANNAENTIKVYDYSGQVVYSAELNSTSTLDLSNLSNGIYFVTYSNGLGTETAKVSIVK